MQAPRPAKPQPISLENSTFAERASLAMLTMLSPGTVALAVAALFLCGGSLPLGTLLTDIYGPTAAAAAVMPAGTVDGAVGLASATSGFRQLALLLAAAPVLPMLLFGAWLPAWICAAIIAVTPPEHSADLSA